VELKSKPGAPADPVKLIGVELAELDLSAARVETGAGTLTISGVTSTLASAEAFGGFYGAGEKLDDLTITLGAACGVLPQNPGGAATPPPVTQGEDLVPPLAFRPQALARTGADPEVLLAVAGFLLLSGAALRYRSRRRRS
jgi:LPXTG-motif cell wall-anchored protein